MQSSEKETEHITLFTLKMIIVIPTIIINKRKTITKRHKQLEKEEESDSIRKEILNNVQRKHTSNQISPRITFQLTGLH